MRVKAILVNLTDPVFAQVQLPQLPKLLQMLNFYDFVLRGKKHL